MHLKQRKLRNWNTGLTKVNGFLFPLNWQYISSWPILPHCFHVQTYQLDWIQLLSPDLHYWLWSAIYLFCILGSTQYYRDGPWWRLSSFMLIQIINNTCKWWEMVASFLLSSLIDCNQGLLPLVPQSRNKTRAPKIFFFLIILDLFTKIYFGEAAKGQQINTEWCTKAQKQQETTRDVDQLS